MKTMMETMMGWRRAAILTWVVAFVVARSVVIEGVGVNWGTRASQNLHPSMIVQMLEDNKIGKVKLFDSDHWTVKYFAGTGIEVMLGIPNNQLASFADSYDNAKDWVKNDLTTHLYDGGVNIKSFHEMSRSCHPTMAQTWRPFPALKNIQKAINDEGLGDKIKATIPQNGDVYDSGSGGPSAGQFRSDIRDLMTQIVNFLQDNNSPFLANIYPFLSLYQNPDFPVEFAFFDGRATPVQDNGISYTNMFDANLYTLVWSLRKAGAPKVKIVIGEIGWPTDGDKNANLQMAKRFYDGFFKKMATKKGTPLYPGDIQYYLFSLTDENQKSIAPGDFERHWGLFRYDRKPKFPMDITGQGQGQDKMLVGAKNVKYLETQWCVFNGDIKIMDKVSEIVDYACSRSDCTSLQEGASCKGLPNVVHISYAFNMYFQMNNQDVEACNFEGLAKIVKANFSTPQCYFPIAIETSGWKPRMQQTGAVIFSGISSLLLVLYTTLT